MGGPRDPKAGALPAGRAHSARPRGFPPHFLDCRPAPRMYAGRYVIEGLLLPGRVPPRHAARWSVAVPSCRLRTRAWRGRLPRLAATASRTIAAYARPLTDRIMSCVSESSGSRTPKTTSCVWPRPILAKALPTFRPRGRRSSWWSPSKLNQVGWPLPTRSSASHPARAARRASAGPPAG
jgi:hypothetical protein